jgi:hypothetical protein
MRSTILVLGGALLCSGILRASGICVTANPNPLLGPQCIYSNFGNPQSFNPNFGLNVAFTAVAIPFTPAASFTLDDIEVAAHLPAVDDSATFSIFDSVNFFPDYPGTALESFTFSGPPASDVSPDAFSGTFTAASILHPLLNAGQEYWVVMESVSSSAYWNANTIGVLGAAATADPDGHWNALNNTQGAVALDGTPSNIPEPASWLLSGSALSGLLVILSRRKSPLHA